MDPNELARRSNALPDQFADRLNPTTLRHVREDIGAGEWGPGIDNLLAGLANAAAPITREEHQELAELLAAMNMTSERLDALTVTG